MDTIDVSKEKWDYLIILDACRYDYFERIYGRYLTGRLEKRLSVGSSTNEWRDKSFAGRHEDIVYISANPQICADSPVYGYKAGDHFAKVCEVWKDHWDVEMGTVFPEVLTAAALDIIRNDAGHRFVIHYLQPHAPYLSLSSESRGYVDGDINTVRSLVGTDTSGNLSKIRNKLLKYLLLLIGKSNVLTNQPAWVLRKMLHIPPKAPLESAWRKVGRDKLRQAYEDNLRSALEQVAELIRYLKGTIVVTADHGELLGEQRLYGHPTGFVHPILREVPWLTIEKDTAESFPEISVTEQADKDRTDSQAGEEAEQKKLAEKLKALGYFD